MANLISNTRTSFLTGKMGDWFDTFSAGRTIVVYKDSSKTVTAPDSTELVYGYGDDQPQTTYSYSEVKQSFPAVIRYRKGEMPNRNDLMEHVDFRFPESETSITVRQDAYEYIIADRTSKITFDGSHWTIVGGPRHKPFLTLSFWYFELKKIV